MHFYRNLVNYEIHYDHGNKKNIIITQNFNENNKQWWKMLSE